MPGPGTVQVAASGCAAVRSLPASVAWVNETTDRDARTRARIEQHWQASESGDADTEHAIYAADAILDYPQSGERFRSRSKIQAQRGGHPAERHFTVLRIRGGGDLWVSEVVITYDGAPSYSVSVMEFTGDLVAHETQYFGDPFQAPAWRAALSEPIQTATGDGCSAFEPRERNRRRGRPLRLAGDLDPVHRLYVHKAVPLGGPTSRGKPPAGGSRRLRARAQ